MFNAPDSTAMHNDDVKFDSLMMNLVARLQDLRLHSTGTDTDMVCADFYGTDTSGTEFLPDGRYLRRKRQTCAGYSFTYFEREFLNDSTFGANRTKFLHQIYAVLKQENNRWANDDGTLVRICDSDLKLWAQEIEDTAAQEAEDNHPVLLCDSTFMQPFTDKQIYDKARTRIMWQMQDSLIFFKHTVRKFAKDATFADEVQAIVEGSFDMKMSNNCSKRTLEEAFDESEVDESSRKRNRP